MCSNHNYNFPRNELENEVGRQWLTCPFLWPFFELVMHICGCAWHTYPFIGAWLYLFGILLVVWYSSCYHIPSNLPPCTFVIFALLFILVTSVSGMNLPLLCMCYVFCTTLSFHMRSQLSEYLE